VHLEVSYFIQCTRSQHFSEIFAAISFNDDKVAFGQRELISVIYVEEIRSAGLELDNIQWLSDPD
jgi:hypothetical protein